jgi:dihydropteroate synthase
MVKTPLVWAGLSLARPLVMGILNVTPDSFSDGGRFGGAQGAVAAGVAMAQAGADIVDVGGESTRPGAALVSVEEELARVVPVVAGLAAAGVVVSIDTRSAAVMAACLDAGARIVNDVSGLKHDPGSRALVAARGCPVVIMHMRGSPMTMNCQAHYTDVVEDVLAELVAARDAAVAAGLAGDNIALDPGLGFAKLGAQNLALLRATARFAALGHPLLIGLSRKKFIGEFGREPDAQKRLPGSLAAGLYALAHGAHILRVHDVAESVQALRVWHSLIAGEHGPED